MDQSVVDRVHREFTELLGVLDANGEISLRASADDHFRKSLLLCAASNFERTLTESVVKFVEDRTNSDAAVVSLVKNKGVERQYHTWFDWDKRNANKFFSLFGDGFKLYMQDKVKKSAELEFYIRCFIEIGSERNRLVYQDFASFTMELTADDVYERYEGARKFVEAVPGLLREYCASVAPQDVVGGQAG